jgi:acylphosphatase
MLLIFAHLLIMIHHNITVSGKVQGVFFRASAKRMADLLGIKGFVRNEPNSDVYLEAEGDEDMLVKFIQWCHHGPEKAEVKHVSVKQGVFLNYKTFEINR